MRSARHLIAALLAIACSSSDSSRASADSTAPAASGAATVNGEPTANDIADYKLDMDRMRKYAAAMRGFASIAATDSAAAQAMGTHADQSTAQAIARIESSPAAMRVLRDAGLTPTDFVWTTAAWLQAAMTQAALDANPQANLIPGQNPQNVEFVRAHRAELEALTRDLERR